MFWIITLLLSLIGAVAQVIFSHPGGLAAARIAEIILVWLLA